MKRIFELSVILLLLAGSSQVRAAETRECTSAEWGFGYFKVEEGGEVWTYAVRVSGPDWEHSPYGWHAPGLLACKSCFSHGLYHFASSVVPPPGGGEYKRPETAAERVDRRSEDFGYPYLPLGADALEHQASREQVVVGPLAGYAVRYSLKGYPAEKLTNEGKKPSLLALSLTDGCVTFETTIVISSAEGEHQWATLDSLLSEFSIVRTSSSEGPNPVRGAISVRPRRPNEEQPAWFRKPRPTDAK